MFKPKLLTTLGEYTREQFFSDLVAGIVVGIVAIPLAFVLGIVGTLTSPDRGDPEVNAEFEVRALTGVGAEKAVTAH